ncbi:MAG: Xaa-Pro peptidase family protein [Chloroflexi bacterium]|nr:Xaa-Pro peptidase family protein [Chloroflexota bacterium]
MLDKDRLRRAQDRMRDQGIDAYLILTHDDYIYFFGEDRFQPRAIVPAMGLPIIVTFIGEEDEVKRSIGVEDARVFGTVGQQIKDVVGVMREMMGGKESMTVGVQMWFNTPAFLLTLFQRANPKVRVVDIAPVMDELRMIKDEGEIALIRRASQIAAAGIETAAQCLRPGTTENAVGAEIEYAMRKAGGNGVATPVFVNSGVRSGWLHGTTSHKEIEVGDLVVVDVVPRYKGYCANMTRTFVIGPPTAEQRAMFETYRRAQAAGIEALRPGVRNRDIDTAAQEVFAASGYGDLYVSGISHGIGLDFEELPRPTIHPADSRVELREKMAVTVGHSVLSVPGVGGVRIEDTFHLTDEGPERLTAYDLDFELDAD